MIQADMTLFIPFKCISNCLSWWLKDHIISWSVVLLMMEKVF
jgi:hypothetical protein